MKFWLLVIIFFSACTSVRKMNWPERTSLLTGTKFYQEAAVMNWKQRDSFVVKEIFSGNFPAFLKKFIPIRVTVMYPATNKNIQAVFFVAPDYLAVGTEDDWSRVCITPLAAQKIADSLGCFLPTRKMVDDIYKVAEIKLKPVPLFAFRDSTPTMWHHHLIIEGQRERRMGLIAGIKKDVVISGKISRDTKQNRVAIYGWHNLDGKPIQSLYTGHVNWYVDYSHGIRLVFRKILVGKKWMDYTEVLKDPVLQKLLCDEEYCDFYRYPDE